MASDLEYWIAVFDTTDDPDLKQEAREMLNQLVCGCTGGVINVPDQDVA